MNTQNSCFGCSYEACGGGPNEAYRSAWTNLKNKFAECVANDMDRTSISTVLHDLFVKDFMARLHLDHVTGLDRLVSDWLYDHFMTHTKE